MRPCPTRVQGGAAYHSVLLVFFESQKAERSPSAMYASSCLEPLCQVSPQPTQWATLCQRCTPEGSSFGQPQNRGFFFRHISFAAKTGSFSPPWTSAREGGGAWRSVRISSAGRLRARCQRGCFIVISRWCWCDGRSLSSVLGVFCAENIPTKPHLQPAAC